MFLGKAVIILCKAAKSRDTDHLNNLVVDAGRVDESEIAALIEAADADLEIPEWVYDVHTTEGRRMARTKDDFFRDEHAGLTPHLPGLFDHLFDE